jgi:hypothetical protein
MDNRLGKYPRNMLTKTKHITKKQRNMIET